MLGRIRWGLTFIILRLVVFCMHHLVTRALLGLRVRLWALALFNVVVIRRWITKLDIDDDFDIGPPVEDNYFINVLDNDATERIPRSPGLLSLMYHWRSICQCFALDYRSSPFTVQPGEICVVMLATPNILGYAAYSIAMNRMYCAQRGYAFEVYTERLDPVRHPSWHKIRAMQEVLDQDKYKYVFWIDADAIFTDFEAALEEVCWDVDFCFTTDPPMWTTIANGGVWMCRNTPSAKAFLAKVWEVPVQVPAFAGYTTLHPWEQAAINYELLTMPHEELPHRVKIMDSSAFNFSFQQEGICAWVPNQRREEPFVHHMQSTASHPNSFKTRFLQRKLEEACARYSLPMPPTPELPPPAEAPGGTKVYAGMAYGSTPGSGQAGASDAPLGSELRRRAVPSSRPQVVPPSPGGASSGSKVAGDSCDSDGSDDSGDCNIGGGELDQMCKFLDDDSD